jgi:hypothetical protein
MAAAQQPPNGWYSTVVPWIQWPPQTVQPTWAPDGSKNDAGGETKLYSGLTVWEIVAIILVIIFVLVIIILIILLIWRCGCCWCWGPRGASSGNAGPWCSCDWWSCCCGCCVPYQPYRRSPVIAATLNEPDPVVVETSSGTGYISGAKRYNGRSIDGYSGRSGPVDRIIVIDDDHIKERRQPSIRRTLVRRQQLVTSLDDDDSYSRTGRFHFGETSSTAGHDKVVAVVHRNRYEDDDAGDYDDDDDGCGRRSTYSRPRAVAHLAVDKPTYSGIGSGYHSAAYDVIASGGTIRYPSLHDLR